MVKLGRVRQLSFPPQLPSPLLYEFKACNSKVALSETDAPQELKYLAKKNAPACIF